MVSHRFSVIINKMSDIINYKIFTHSLSGFVNYVIDKLLLTDRYCIQCTLPHYVHLHRL